MGKFWESAVGGFAQQAAQGAIGAGLGLIMQKSNDRRQIRQQEKLQALEIAGQKQMTDYNQKKQLEMWENTGYGAQKEQMKKAGLNPGLMYGMGGGGGQTAGITPGNVSGGNASGQSGEMSAMAMNAAQVGLINAQRRNLDADTQEKLMGAKDKGASAEGKGLANAWEAWMQGMDEYGKPVENVDDKDHQYQNLNESVKGRQAVENLIWTRTNSKVTIDKNQREQLLNSAAVAKIGEEIELMKKKGLTETQILENLKKEGTLKDAEIEWNKMDLEPGNFGKFLTNLVKMFIKPR